MRLIATFLAAAIAMFVFGYALAASAGAAAPPAERSMIARAG